MEFREVMQMTGKWGGTLKFFPGDPDARIGIAEEIVSFASTADQVEWLVKKVSQVYKEWPGILEVRAVFCTRYKPADGVEASLGTTSPAFVALCSEPTDDLARLQAPQRLQISGQVEIVTEDTEFNALVKSIAKAKSDPLATVKSATEDDIERLKAIQNANRKESQPA